MQLEFLESINCKNFVKNIVYINFYYICAFYIHNPSKKITINNKRPYVTHIKKRRQEYVFGRMNIGKDGRKSKFLA